MEQLKKSMGIKLDNSNLVERFKGQDYPAKDILDRETENFILLSEIFGTGANFSKKINEKLRNIGVLSWKGRLKNRNYNSYKIFTNGIANLIETATRRIITKESEPHKDFTKGFYSFHVP